MDTFNRIQNIFRDIFDDETLVLTKETSIGDIEDWDSIAHINIILACESEFEVKFNLNDIANITNVGDIMDLIEGKLG